jgi:4-hydroxybenzoate polyprenyltransferase
MWWIGASIMAPQASSVTSGRISPSAALGFALLLAVIGMALLLTLPTSWQPG